MRLRAWVLSRVKPKAYQPKPTLPTKPLHNNQAFFLHNTLVYTTIAVGSSAVVSWAKRGSFCFCFLFVFVYTTTFVCFFCLHNFLFTQLLFVYTTTTFCLQPHLLVLLFLICIRIHKNAKAAQEAKSEYKQQGRR